MTRGARGVPDHVFLQTADERAAAQGIRMDAPDPVPAEKRARIEEAGNQPLAQTFVAEHVLALHLLGALQILKAHDDSEGVLLNAEQSAEKDFGHIALSFRELAGSRQLDTFKVVSGDEIGDAGNGIGAIQG